MHWVHWIPVLGLMAVAQAAATQSTVREWLTTSDRKALLTEQRGSVCEQECGPTDVSRIEVDTERRFQSIDGFGFALTGGSAQLLMRMDAGRRTALLRELVGRGPEGIGVSYLRVSIGASDMNERVFTYDDVPTGARDPELRRFSLAEDDRDVVPVLRAVLRINPKVRIMATPWTAPSWMKTNGAAKGGELKPEFYGVYARYLVRYLQEMQRRGIAIDAITVQNEPLNANNTPSMMMTADEEAAFVGEALGPALAHAGSRTKIVAYDHNCDRPDYPLAVLADARAAQFVDGSGFHLYGGTVTAMSAVHEAYPQKNLYFTEQMVIDEKGSGALAVAKPVAAVMVGATRNWAKVVLLWNLAADAKNGPHTDDGGCPVCEGAITLEGDTITRNVAYYALAHASQFVPPGSVRVASSEVKGLANVAFTTPEGRVVLVVSNPGGMERRAEIQAGEKTFVITLPQLSVATFVW